MAEIPAAEIRTGQRIRVDLVVHATYRAGVVDGIVTLSDDRRALLSVPVDRLVEVELVCRGCGCTDDDPCDDHGLSLPCEWVEHDLCSACTGPLQENARG